MGVGQCIAQMVDMVEVRSPRANVGGRGKGRAEVGRWQGGGKGGRAGRGGWGGCVCGAEGRGRVCRVAGQGWVQGGYVLAAVGMLRLAGPACVAAGDRKGACSGPVGARRV